MSQYESAVHRFFERYGKALSSGDPDIIVDCWRVPAFVLSDMGVQPVSEAKEVEMFFRSAIAQYQSQGD